ncbi:Isonitrile hydratase [Escovopsis weberi]|uniref:Isonitrile hydratase n=1 Tax=Escovopsis weberi TaxID=150374 RepID=A0A0M9VWU3_ESCWE|nr:Isonitrile hydratase [Escovopsis weberi]
MASMAAGGPPPTKYGVALFPGFQALDLFGPLDILNILSASVPLQLSIMSTTLDPVSTLAPSPSHRHPMVGQSIVPTHTFATAPRDIQVLIVPGGRGTRDIAGTHPVVDYIRETYPRLRYILTVCTGSVLLARAGLLDGKRATSNKSRFDTVVASAPQVDWIRRARWVTDGNFWTSSGISAGLDMTYAFVAQQYGPDIAKDIAWRSEYVWNSDPGNDPFAAPLRD